MITREQFYEINAWIKSRLNSAKTIRVKNKELAITFKELNKIFYDFEQKFKKPEERCSACNQVKL